MIFQTRSELIKNANSALESGLINFNGFLNRVTCKEAKLMDGMLEFDNVADDDDEDVDTSEDVDASEEVGDCDSVSSC